MAAMVPGDLIRCTASFDPAEVLTARGNRFGLPGSNMATSPAGGQPGLPIILTCADGVVIDSNNLASNLPVLDLRNCRHVWAVGFNVRGGQFGIRGVNWGGSAGFPAYRAYNTITTIGHSGLIAQGQGASISGAGGTPEPGAENAWGYSSFFVDEMNTISNLGLGTLATPFGEALYYGMGSDPGWLSHARDFWVRGNVCSGFTSDGIDIKPGCMRWSVTDNVFHAGASHNGAMIQCLYVGESLDARPSWAGNPEGHIEGNRFYNHNITRSQATSSPFVIQVSLAGVTIANNIMWAIANSNPGGTPSGTGIAVRLRTGRIQAESRVGNEQFVVVNNVMWTGEGVSNGGAGVGGAFTGPFPTAWIDARNNIGSATTTGVQHQTATSAFIAPSAIPAIGTNTANAQLGANGVGSAFDLAAGSALVGAGVSIADLDLLIDADVFGRPIPATPNPGPFQP
jgi:hypothetical protein